MDNAIDFDYVGRFCRTETTGGVLGGGFTWLAIAAERLPKGLWPTWQQVAGAL